MGSVAYEGRLAEGPALQGKREGRVEREEREGRGAGGGEGHVSEAVGAPKMGENQRGTGGREGGGEG